MTNSRPSSPEPSSRMVAVWVTGRSLRRAARGGKPGSERLAQLEHHGAAQRVAADLLVRLRFETRRVDHVLAAIEGVVEGDGDARALGPLAVPEQLAEVGIGLGIERGQRAERQELRVRVGAVEQEALAAAPEVEAQP